MEPQKKPTPVSRQCDQDAYKTAILSLISTCECAVKNAYDRDDQIDVAIAQGRLIAALKLVVPVAYLER